MIRTSLAALIVAGLAAAPAVAEQDQIQIGAAIGPEVGSAAPDVSLVRPDGTEVSLDALTGTNGVAISFVRSLDWCPYCQKQAAELEAANAPLEAAGWPLVLVSYDDTETLAEFAAKKELTYTLASDPDSAAIMAFGLLNEDMPKGSKYWGVPHPAIVFIDADGTVAAVLREEGYKDRPPVEVVTQTALDLNEAAGR